MNILNFTHLFWKNAKPCVDSRKVGIPSETIFFALKGQRRDGHDFVEELYKLGVKKFVVEHIPTCAATYTDATFLCVANPLVALQQWAAYHRQQFDIPVVAITGSNGKTIVKEWLATLLSDQFFVVKSPKSYNSQIGVPLSVLELNKTHTIAVFEAGISKTNEMATLASMLLPSIGIFTNIGNAHDEGFENTLEKIKEKALLFKDCAVLIFPFHQQAIYQYITQEPSFSNKTLYAWGSDVNASILVHKKGVNQLSISFKNKHYTLNLPFAHNNTAAFENLMNAVCVLLHFNYNEQTIQQQINLIRDVPMRLIRKEGANQCTLIDDSYNNDWIGLRSALDFWRQTHKERYGESDTGKTVILSDILESGQPKPTFYASIARLLTEYKIQKLIAIGTDFYQFQSYFSVIPTTVFYKTTDEVIAAIQTQQLTFQSETILIKAARTFELERVVQMLKKRIHSTVLEIHLNALAHNYQWYKHLLHADTKVMAMVKAFAYGSGGYEVARLLQQQKIDYLGVAYTDEGALLRQRGISTPILVMNVATTEFNALLKYQLEPVVYSFRMLHALIEFCVRYQTTLNIHIEWDTGMHRLGFDAKDLPEVIRLLQENQQYLIPISTFSHLAASEEAVHTEFTQHQIEEFKTIAHALQQVLHRPLIRHILNSGGIARFAADQMEMVRLGIGLYGIDPSGLYRHQLQPVATLKTIISQVKELPSGTTIGYSRKGKLTRPSRIATIAIGYADGIGRSFGNGKGGAVAQGKWLPTVGNICMDMCFIDVTDTDLQEGDEVELFGKTQSIETVSAALETIPYEVLTRISTRVPREFYED